MQAYLKNSQAQAIKKIGKLIGLKLNIKQKPFSSHTKVELTQKQHQKLNKAINEMHNGTTKIAEIKYKQFFLSAALAIDEFNA